MSTKYYDKDESIGLGGFDLNNIRLWIIREAEESGNYDSFLYNLVDVLDDLIYDLENEPDTDLEDDDEDWEDDDEEDAF